MAPQGDPATIPQGNPATTQPSKSTPLPSSDIQIFPFLKLPRELRDKIYRSVFVHNSPLYPYEHKSSCSASSWSHSDMFSTSRQIRADLQIFRVSQQIHDEAREIFLNENEFEYQESYMCYKCHKWVKAPRCGMKKVPRCSQNRRFLGVDAIKNTRSVKATFGDRNDMIADFIGLLAQNQHLRSLKLSFENMTDSLLIACQKALPQLEAVKVRDSVVFEFLGRRGRVRATRREREFGQYLGVLKENMMAK